MFFATRKHRFCHQIATLAIIAQSISVFDARIAEAKDKDTDLRITIRVAGNHSPPYRNFRNTQPGGIYIDYFREALGKRYKIVFVEMPFARALTEMKAGSVDVMLGPNRTAERERYMHYTRYAFPPVDKVILIRDSDVFSPTLPSELEGLKIGSVRGAAYTGLVAKNRGKVHEVNSLESAARMLAAGRLDAVIMTSDQAIPLVRQFNLVQAPLMFPGNWSFVTISKKSRVLEHVDHIEHLLLK